MAPELWVALGGGPAATLLVDRAVGWLRNRRKDDAEAGLTVDQRWKAWADELKAEVEDLRARITKIEEERDQERQRVKALTAEVDKYRQIAKVFARHVLRLREALGKTGAEVPVMPSDVEDALTIINLP